MDHVLAQQIAFRGFQLADRVAAIRSAHKAHHAFRVGGGRLDQLPFLVKQTECRASKRHIILIDLPNQDFRLAVFKGGNGLFRVHKGAVQRDRDPCQVFEIAGQRLGFSDGICPIRDALKCRQSARIGYRGSLERAVFAEKAKFNARQRFPVRIHLLNGEAGSLIRQGRLTGHFAVFMDGKGHLYFAERIAFGSPHLPKGVRSRNRRECGEGSVLTGIPVADHLPFGISDLDERARQRLRTGQIRLGNPHIGMNDFVMDGRFHPVDHLMFLVCKFPRDADAIAGILQHPPFRGKQFLHIVFPVGKFPVEGQLTILIGDAGSDERVRFKDFRAIRNGITGEQPEDKALTRMIHQHGSTHAVLSLLHGHGFLFFGE